MEGWLGDFFAAWSVIRRLVQQRFNFVLPSSRKNAERTGFFGPSFGPLSEGLRDAAAVVVGLPDPELNLEDVGANLVETLLPLPLPGRPCLLGFCLPQALIALQNELLEANPSLLIPCRRPSFHCE